MATNIVEVAGLLDEVGIIYQIRDDGKITAAFGTSNYINPTGKTGIVIAIEMSEDGEFLSVFAPGAYSVPLKQNNSLWFLKVCSQIEWQSKLVRYEYDESDGEVRPSIHLALEDNKLTAQQLRRYVSSLPQIIDRYDPELRKALGEKPVIADDADEEDEDPEAEEVDPEQLALMQAWFEAEKAKTERNHEDENVKAEPSGELSDEDKELLDKFA